MPHGLNSYLTCGISMTTSEIENYIYNINISIKFQFSLEIEKSMRTKSCWECELPELGITVFLEYAKGISNQEIMKITHHEYTIKYQRNWPDYSTSSGRYSMIGSRHYNWLGNTALIKELYIFLMLRQ